VSSTTLTLVVLLAGVLRVLLVLLAGAMKFLLSGLIASGA
jgi:hypothetical protein